MITEYDLLGLATKSIDLAGNATCNYFDERGRLTKATYPVIGDVDYFYDPTGLKTKVTDASGRIEVDLRKGIRVGYMSNFGYAWRVWPGNCQS